MKNDRVVVRCPDRPFRGLEPYRFADQAIFFERETEIKKLLQLTTIYRSSLLYGESGAGKSSLINAGFIPQVINGMIVERIRVQPELDSEFVVERIEGFSSGEFLPSRLIHGDQRTVLSAPELLSRIAASGGKPASMLIFDQFEEFHTLASDKTEQRIAEAIEAQNRIIETLVKLTRDPQLSIRLLLVFREDYLAKFDRLFYLCPELPDHFLRLTPPTPESIHQILRGPFTTETLSQPCWDHEISPGLANDLMEKLVPGGGRATINLAQVQIVALQLWLSDAPEEALRKRGVGGLVEDYQEGALAPLGRDKQLAESLLTFMITSEGTRKVLLETEAIEHAKREESVGEDTVRLVLNRLLNETRLVRRDFNRNAASYEIVSEFLVPWIRRLKLQRAAKHARNRLLRRSAVILVVVFLTLVGVFSWKYYRTNKEQAVLDAKNETKKASETAAEAARKYSAEHDARLAAEGRERETLNTLHSSSTNDQVKKLSDDLLRLQQSSSSAQTAIADLRQKNDDQQKRLQDLGKTVEDQRKTIDQSKAEAAAASSEATIAKSKLGEVNSELTKLKSENQKLRDELEAFKKQVVLNVSVLDDWNRILTGLEHQDFKVFEDNIEQRIAGFTDKRLPLSAVIVFDMGHNSEPVLNKMRGAAIQFLKTLNEETDETSLILCGEQAQISVPFTNAANYEPIQTALVKGKLERRTALVDGIYLALNELKKGRNPRKAIVIFSKEWNNSSHHRLSEIEQLANHTEALIYPIVINTSMLSFRDLPGPLGVNDTLARISDQTGGRGFIITPDEVIDVATKVGFEILNLYVLRYQSTNKRVDGRLRRIDVKFMHDMGFHTNLHYRRGYYPPSTQ